MSLQKAALPFQACLDGGPLPSDLEIKDFQKLIIRESKISRNNDPRQSYDFVEATEDNPTPNQAKKKVKLNPPINTKPYQDLLQQVIAKKNEPQRH